MTHNMFEIKLAYGMMLNALSQLRDGIPFDEVTVNPDISKYYDMDMNQVLQFAGKVYDDMDGNISESVSALKEIGVEQVL